MRQGFWIGASSGFAITSGLVMAFMFRILILGAYEPPSPVHVPLKPGIHWLKAGCVTCRIANMGGTR